MSNIQWTDITSNPIHLIREDSTHGGHWCQKISPGCANCYAETQNQSNYFKFASHLPYTGKVPQNLIFDEEVMQKLINMRSPKKIFLCSMTDLFGEWVPDEWIDLIFAYMAIAKQHTFQILTKRPERMQEYLAGKIPLPNVWLGVSVENQKVADERIPLLLTTPAKLRFLSCEPLLEELNLVSQKREDGIYNYLLNTWETRRIGAGGAVAGGRISPYSNEGINWVIVGAESGSRARPCDVNWIRSIVQQCQKSNVAVFVKQLGSKPINSDNGLMRTPQLWLNLKDRKGGNIDEFPEDLKIRQFPVN